MNYSMEDLKKLNSLDLFKFIMSHTDDEKFLIDNQRALISQCTSNFNMYDYFSLNYLSHISAFNEEIAVLLDSTIKKVFSNITLMLLIRIYRLLRNGRLIPEDVFDYIISNCNSMLTTKASVILFELTIFNDFKKKLHDVKPLVATIINSYMNYDINIIGSEMFKGSSVIAKLALDDNEKKVLPYVMTLLNGKTLDSNNIVTIGGGGSSLVFKINNLILKLGESRNRKITFANHRILQSKVRDFIYKDDELLFCVEVMNPAIVGDVTEEERDELVRDLFEQGIIWEDSKLENCGVLQDGDNNDSVDFNDLCCDSLIKVIDNPISKENFLKRTRRVVVIDNDDMMLRRNYWK